MYRICQDKIAACDRQLQQHLKGMEPKVDLESQPLGPRPKGKRARVNAPKFDLRTELYRITGVDWAQVDGIDVQVAQSVIEHPTERLKTRCRGCRWSGASDVE